MEYYSLIMGKEESSFLSMFNKAWKEEISDHDLLSADALQNEKYLRPLLIAWGYYANCEKEANSFVVDYAISIELLQQASDLLERLVDGSIAFCAHCSKYESLQCIQTVLNRSMELMYRNDITRPLYATMLSTLVAEMMEEEADSASSTFSTTMVKEFVESENILAIENSFILGYRLSATNTVDVPEAIINVGHSFWYCFRVLNDVEIFSGDYRDQNLKKNINIDIERLRGDIVISFLYGCCTQREREQLEDGAGFKYVCSLVKKYNVIPILTTELETEVLQILKELQYFKEDNLCYYTGFRKFLDVLLME